jgi:hypothetical protein
MADELDGVIDSTDMVRRTFMRRLVTGTVFAAPVVASFAMAGVEAASAAAHDRYHGPPQGNSNSSCGSLSPIGNANTTTGQNPGPFGGDGPPYGGGGPPFFGFGPPPRGFGSGR